MLGILRGLLLLSRFDAEGFRYLAGRPQDVLGSLAPLLAFPIVFTGTALLGGGSVEELTALLAAIGVLLLPLVTSEALARRWQREPAWGRFAVAFNWSQWTLTVVAGLVLLLAGLLAAGGLPQRLVAAVAMLLILGYQLGLHWFLARRGLDLSRLRATLLVLALELSSSMLIGLFLALEGVAEMRPG